MSSDQPPFDGPPLLSDIHAAPPGPTPLGVGSVLADRYRITGVLGDGGMGAVYLAEHVTLGKVVAIKVLKSEFAHDSTMVERFFREARATAAIDHDNVVEILDFGETPECAFFAMEALSGCELADLIGNGRTIDWDRAKPIVIQIARGLGAAHQVGIVHRDMKPGNVFLIRRTHTPDFVKVLDFGIAKIDDGLQLTQVGAVFGTASYMAPEQASGGAVDGRTDMYALGCMIFEMFTGQVPFPGDNFMKVLGQHISTVAPRMQEVAPYLPIPAHLIEAVEAVVARMLAKYPDQRYADMAELERALLHIDPSLPRWMAAGTPLPPELQAPPLTNGPGPSPDANPDQATRMISGMGGSSIADLDAQTLAPLAYLFVAFAHGTDGVLTNAEMRALAGRLRHWAPQVGLDGIGAALRDAVGRYTGAANKTATLAEVRADINARFSPASLMQIVADLREIASADGRIADSEERFVAETARAFGLTGDNRLEALAFMYLALGAATTGNIAATEMKVLGEQLRQWAPGASANDAGAALRAAVDDYKRLAGPEARLARAREAAETLRRSTDAETLRHVLADLWRIAGADGMISPEEQGFIMDMVQRFSG